MIYMGLGQLIAILVGVSLLSICYGVLIAPGLQGRRRGRHRRRR
jgi:hypothetical protein